MNNEKTLIKDIFKKYFSPVLSGFDLRIEDNSYIYTRIEKESIQQIEFIISISKNDGEIVYMKIYPRINVYFRNINETAKLIFRKCMSGFYWENIVDSSTYSIPVERLDKKHIGNKDSRIMDINDCSKEALRLQALIRKKAIPFLNKIKTVDDFIACGENETLMYKDRYAVFLITAYMLKSKKSEAMRLAEKYFKNDYDISRYNAFVEYAGC